MTKNSSNINESAKRYAKALVLSAENKDSLIKSFRNDFSKLLSTFNEVENFKEFILSPLVKKQKKKEILIKILSKMNFSTEIISFFKIVANHGKLFAETSSRERYTSAPTLRTLSRVGQPAHASTCPAGRV